MKSLTKLRRLEQEITELRRLERTIPKLTGERREEALKIYRELMWDFKDDPTWRGMIEQPSLWVRVSLGFTYRSLLQKILSQILIIT